MARVLSLVERGWRGARECSLVLSQRGIAVTHLIKGVLGSDVRSMIRPVPQVGIVDVPRGTFRLYLFAMLLGDLWARQLRWVLIDNERTLHQLRWWCRRVGLTPVSIRELQNGYELRVNDEPRSPDEIFGS